MKNYLNVLTEYISQNYLIHCIFGASMPVYPASSVQARNSRLQASDRHIAAVRKPAPARMTKPAAKTLSFVTKPKRRQMATSMQEHRNDITESDIPDLKTSQQSDSLGTGNESHTRKKLKRFHNPDTSAHRSDLIDECTQEATADPVVSAASSSVTSGSLSPRPKGKKRKIEEAKVKEEEGLIKTERLVKKEAQEAVEGKYTSRLSTTAFSSQRGTSLNSHVLAPPTSRDVSTQTTSDASTQTLQPFSPPFLTSSQDTTSTTFLTPLQENLTHLTIPTPHGYKRFCLRDFAPEAKGPVTTYSFPAYMRKMMGVEQRQMIGRLRILWQADGEEGPRVCFVEESDRGLGGLIKGVRGKFEVREGRWFEGWERGLREGGDESVEGEDRWGVEGFVSLCS